MANKWWECVCRTPGVVRVSDIRVFGKNETLEDTAPIDRFLTKVEELVKSGSPALLNSNPEIAGLYFVGLISHTENFFRDALSRILENCPISQKRSSNQNINLGSALWFRTGRLERGAFEGTSFASSDNIVTTCRRFFDINLDQKSDCAALLSEYDQLCQLRHCIVHAAGIMSGRNALNLQLPRTKHDTVVSIDFAKFQEAAAICTALVSAFNIELFKIMAVRWRDDWPKSVPGWNPSIASKYFSKLWKLFHSETDESAHRITARLSRVACKKLILVP